VPNVDLIGPDEMARMVANLSAAGDTLREIFVQSANKRSSGN
jgi:hypothetical protein